MIKMAKLLFLCVLLSISTGVSLFKVSFEKLSTLYLPYTYTPTVQYAVDKDAAEQMSYDARTKLLYSVGIDNLHVIDMHDLHDLKVLYHTTLDNVEMTDVEVCGEFVFAASDNKTVREHGFIRVYRGYDNVTGTLELLHHIVVGAIPDMLLPTSDCKRLVIAVEAEPYADHISSSMVDPPGSVTIINFQDTPAGNYTIKVLSFDKFNARLSELELQGVRHIYKGNNNSFSNDVEPEYIAFNSDETKAFICLQENNAIAVVDLKSQEIESIHGLGFKDWRLYNMDPSDRDNGIHLNHWPVYGMYQPDSIHTFTHQGQEYIIAANEGDSKDYEYYTETVMVKNIQLSDVFESNATIRMSLQDNAALGRLKISTEIGKNATTGKFDSLYTYGGRSFSIWHADTMRQVYDSGDDIESIIAAHRPDLFNNDCLDKAFKGSTIDTRSDNKGPETESIAVATFGNVTLVMIGNERPGIISVYSIDNKHPTIQPKFETIISDIPRLNDTWTNLLNDRAISMIDPEDIKYVPAAESPNSRPLLLVSGSVSGTVTVLQINVRHDIYGTHGYDIVG